jgi:hypothetical protein
VREALLSPGCRNGNLCSKLSYNSPNVTQLECFKTGPEPGLWESKPILPSLIEMLWVIFIWLAQHSWGKVAKFVPLYRLFRSLPTLSALSYVVCSSHMSLVPSIHPDSTTFLLSCFIPLSIIVLSQGLTAKHLLLLCLGFLSVFYSQLLHTHPLFKSDYS